MLNIKADAFEQSAELLKALAHPRRLRLLCALSGGEQCVCHLTALLQQRQPYVSQQLGYLRDAGLLTDRKAGLRVYYRLADKRSAPLLCALKVHVETPRAVPHCDCPRYAANLKAEESC